MIIKQQQTLTIAHSLALILMRLWLRSSAYSAPIREPMEVPPMMSTGIPASQIARIIPTWEQPLNRRVDKLYITTFQCNYLTKETIPRTEMKSLRQLQSPLDTKGHTIFQMILPGPSSSQDKGNSIACEDSSQAGEVRVAICWLLKHTLVQLQLKQKCY